MEEAQQIRELGLPIRALQSEIRDFPGPAGAPSRHPSGLPPSTGRIAPVMNVRLVATASTA
jgi:hypothetical protein